MTLKHLLKQYELGVENFTRRLILCNWASQDGFEISSLEEFVQFINKSKVEYYILNRQESKELVIYDYFMMSKVPGHMIAIRHPLMTNAYWKDAPDAIIDVLVHDGIYRYCSVDYGHSLRDYVIEYPADIHPDILKRSKDIVPKIFNTQNKESNTTNISLVFTNTNRFLALGEKNFLVYNLEDIYPEWNVKNITPLTLSRKIWADLKSTKVAE